MACNISKSVPKNNKHYVPSFYHEKEHFVPGVVSDITPGSPVYREIYDIKIENYQSGR